MVLNKRFSRGIAIILATTLICTNGMTLLAKDYEGHWAQEAIAEWTSLGIIKGYEDGTIRPNNAMTRAELAAILSRVFELNYKDQTIHYKDIKKGAWYEQVVQQVMSAQLMNDYNEEFRPNQLATREEAAYALAHAYHLTEKGELSFKDSDLVSDWAKEQITALVAGGYLKGKGNGLLAPLDSLTRAEVVTLLDRLTAKLYQHAGTYTEDVTGNVVINTSDVVLKDMTISGNLYIAEGVGEGDVTLENVEVEGQVIIEGGGEHSVEIKGCTLENIYVDKASGAVRVALDKLSKATHVEIHSATQLEGEVENLEVHTEEAVQLVDASVGHLEVCMAGAKVNVDQTSVVEELVVNAAATISGKGEIKKALIEADHVTLEGVVIEQDKITVGSGVTIQPVIKPSQGQTPGGSTEGSEGDSDSTTEEETNPEGGDQEQEETDQEDQELEDDKKPENGTDSGEQAPGQEVPGDGETPGDTPESEEDNVSDDVEEPGQVVQEIKLSEENKNLLLGEEAVLIATISPEEAQEVELVWTSDNEEVVSVDESGKIVAKGIGKATIKVSTKDGKVSAQCEVQVTGSTLSGKITVEDNQVEGVELLLYSEQNKFEEAIATVKADASGEYKFEDLAKGNYRVQAIYESEEVDYSTLAAITVDEEVENVDMKCEKATSLTVKVVDFKSQKEPILYVRVVVEGKDAQGETWRMTQSTNGAGEAKFIIPYDIEGEITYTLKKDGYEEMTYKHKLEDITKNKVEVAFKKEGEKYYPEVFKPYSEAEGNNAEGLGDTTYEVLKQAGWRVESDTVLSTNSRRLKFENMNGVDGIDAKLTYNRSGFENEELDFDMVLRYMIREQSEATVGDLDFEELKQMIANGTGPHEDGHRIVEVRYDGKVDGIVEIIFYNYGSHNSN